MTQSMVKMYLRHRVVDMTGVMDRKCVLGGVHVAVGSVEKV